MALVSIADQYRIFLECRHVFSGKKARIRKSKAVRAEFQRSRSRAPLQDLIKDYGADNVVCTVCALLREDVFNSDAKAQIFFSEFNYISETDKVTPGLQDNTLSNELVQLNDTMAENGALRENNVTKEFPKKELQIKITSNPPYPDKLPHRVQHIILKSAQLLLEECCFEFGMKWIPEVLAKHDWDCPEAIELNEFTFVLIAAYERLSSEAFLISDLAAMKKILRRTDNIRHTAVHRIRQRSEEVERMLDAGCQLAQALQDKQRLCILQRLQKAVSLNTLREDIEKNRLLQKFNQERDIIIQQRQQLDRKEEAAMALMTRENQENRLSCAVSLETAVKKILSPAATKSLTTMTECLQADFSSKGACQTNLFKNYSRKNASSTSSPNSWEVQDEYLGTLHLDASLHDGTIDNDDGDNEWSSLMATTDFTEAKGITTSSATLLVDSNTSAIDMVSVPKSCDDRNERHDCQALPDNTEEKLNSISNTLLSIPSNVSFKHRSRTSKEQDVLSSLHLPTVTDTKNLEKVDADGMDLSSEHIAACGNQGEHGQFIQNKKRRIFP